MSKPSIFECGLRGGRFVTSDKEIKEFLDGEFVIFPYAKTTLRLYSIKEYENFISHLVEFPKEDINLIRFLGSVSEVSNNRKALAYNICKLREKLGLPSVSREDTIGLRFEEKDSYYEITFV